MPAFNELDWRRFDVWSILCTNGVIVVDLTARHTAHRWLTEYGYSISSVDFKEGAGAAATQFGNLFHWEQQFSYALGPDRRSLDALRDGFGFGLKPEGHVLELLNADDGFQDDPKWLLGVLAIASEHTRRQLALGARFFTMLILEPGTNLTDVKFDSLKIPWFFRTWKQTEHCAPPGKKD